MYRTPLKRVSVLFTFLITCWIYITFFAVLLLDCLDCVCVIVTGTSVVPYLKKRLTHKLGWMALLVSGKTYNWYFNDMDHLTNITYDAKFYGFKVQLDIFHRSSCIGK